MSLWHALGKYSSIGFFLLSNIACSQIHVLESLLRAYPLKWLMNKIVMLCMTNDKNQGLVTRAQARKLQEEVQVFSQRKEALQHFDSMHDGKGSLYAWLYRGGTKKQVWKLKKGWKIVKEGSKPNWRSTSAKSGIGWSQNLSIPELVTNCRSN